MSVVKALVLGIVGSYERVVVGVAEDILVYDSSEQSKSPIDEKTMLARYYDSPEIRQKMFADYESIRSLAQNFRGRSYDLQNPNDRQTMKMVMLSSLRPQALKFSRRSPPITANNSIDHYRLAP